MTPRPWFRWCGAVALASLVAFAASPAAMANDARLASRLDSATAAAVGAVIDSARERGLPVDPLTARALEGASRHAPGARIVAAVRNLAAALDGARAALGTRSSAAELVAGSAAVSAGVGPDVLAALRAAPGRASVVVPLVVLADLVTRRVPVETASAAVLAAARARVPDAELMRLRERVGADIRGGLAPEDATITRTRHLIRTFDPPGRGGGLEPKHPARGRP